MLSHNTAEIIRENERLRAAVAAARAALATAYDVPDPLVTTPPVETAPATFTRERARVEAQTGVRLVKFFAPAGA